MMEQLTGVVRNNQEWLEDLCSGHPEIRQIRKEFAAHMQGMHGNGPSPMIVTGHQPVVYYPGLLFKDHFVGEMAKHIGGSAWNLIVDTDLADFQIPVPYYDNGQLHKTLISIPNPENLAYTSLQLPRQETDHLIQNMDQHLATLPDSQIKNAFSRFRQNFYGLLDAGHRFTEALSALRNKQDATMGHRITDHKISEIVGSYPYAHYVWYIIKHIRDYTSHYNLAVKQGKRKDYQPVKTLHHQDGWYELPFWLEKDGKRLPVNLYKDQQRLIFRAGETGPEVNLVIAGKDEASIIEAIRNSVVLYPKATTLTQVIRLFLSDIFIHGEGAVEYEKVNNTFLRDFFSMKSKGTFFSVSGDIYLPLMENLPDYENLQRDYKQKQQWLKQVDRSPEDHLENGVASQYKEKKKEIVRQMSQEESGEQRRKHHRRLEQLDEEMKDLLSEKMEQVRKKLNHYKAILKKKDILYERQYPYFLYPDEWLTREQFNRNMRAKTQQ